MPRRKKRSHGEGTVYQRKDDGRWVAQFTVGGKRYSFSGKTKTEALDKTHRARVDLAHGSYVHPSKVTLGEWLIKWLEIYKKPSVSENTYLSYKNSIEKHILPAIGHVKIQQLRPIHLQELYLRLQEEGKHRTAALAHAVLHAALAQAVEEGLVPKNVADSLKAPKWKPHRPRALTKDEAQRFLEAASEHPLYPAILLAVATGLRRGEILGLRWKDIDFDLGVLYIRQSLVDIYGRPKIRPVKTESGERCVPVPPVVLEVLRRHRRRQEEAAKVFGWGEVPELVFTTDKGTRVHPRNFNRTFASIKKKAGVDDVSPHLLRHTFATRLMEENVHPRVAQEFLGHASPSTTEAIYSHVMLGLKQQAVSTINNILEEMSAAKPLQKSSDLQPKNNKNCKNKPSET